jgi:hypothetical protein
MSGKKNNVLKIFVPFILILSSIAIINQIRIGKTTRKKRNMILFCKDTKKSGSLKSRS